MKIRMDFNFVGGQPVLVGLFLRGFGWLEGVTGDRAALTVKADLDLSEAEATDDRLLKKLTKAVEGWDFYTHGGRTFEVGRKV